MEEHFPPTTPAPRTPHELHPGLGFPCLPRESETPKREALMRLAYRRPQVPWDVRGLFTALRAEGEGDAAPLGAWMGAGFRSLRRSLEASGLDPAAADEVASEVAVRALSAYRRGAVIGDECAWVSGVAAHVCADAARLQRRTRPLSLSLSLSLSWRFP